MILRAIRRRIVEVYEALDGVPSDQTSGTIVLATLSLKKVIELVDQMSPPLAKQPIGEPVLSPQPGEFIDIDAPAGKSVFDSVRPGDNGMSETVQHGNCDPISGCCLDCGATREAILDNLYPTCEKFEGPYRAAMIVLNRTHAEAKGLCASISRAKTAFAAHSDFYQRQLAELYATAEQTLAAMEVLRKAAERQTKDDVIDAALKPAKGALQAASDHGIFRADAKPNAYVAFHWDSIFRQIDQSARAAYEYTASDPNPEKP